MTISHFNNNLSFGFLSLLCYVVCVYAFTWPKIRNKIQFSLEPQETKLCEQTYNAQPLTIPVAFVLNQLVVFIKKKKKKKKKKRF